MHRPALRDSVLVRNTVGQGRSNAIGAARHRRRQERRAPNQSPKPYPTSTIGSKLGVGKHALTSLAPGEFNGHLRTEDHRLS